MSVIRFLPNVNPRDVHPAIWIALGVAHLARVGVETLDPDTWVTSLNDGSHTSPNTLHDPANTLSGLCQAIDIRTKDIAPTGKHGYVLRVANALQPLGYDIVFHDGTQPGVAEHLHIEFQPKAGERWRVPGFA